MNEREALWARVQRVLDRHCDPLTDARVGAMLARQPEERVEVERLVALVRALGPLASARRRPAAVRVGLALVGAAALALVVTLADRPAVIEQVEARPSRSRVLALRMTSERRAADEALLERRALTERDRSKITRIRPQQLEDQRTRTSATLVAWTETETRP